MTALKLQLGQPVHTSDGVFGELSDIVIDPHRRVVTHIVVEPDHQHLQARLVPIWLVTATGAALLISLDDRHVRQLQRVAHSEFLRMDQPVTVEAGWDIGAQDVVAMPYFLGDFDTGDLGVAASQGLVTVNYDTVPKGECEIRRKSEVLSSDGHVVGHVEGLLAQDEDLVAVVVLAGLPGIRRHVLIPMGSVAKVMNDRIELSMDRPGFKALPDAEGLQDPRGTSPASPLADRAARTARLGVTQLEKVAGALKDLIDPRKNPPTRK